MGPFAVAAGAEEWHFARGLNVLSKPPAAVGVPRAPAQVKVDGDLADWAGVAPVPLPSHNGAPGWLKLCWTEAGLYGSVDVQDEGVSVDKDSLMSGDALQVSLGRPGATIPGETRTAAWLTFAPAPDLGPGPAHVEPAGMSSSESDKAVGIECAWAPTARGYTLEFFLPAAFLKPASTEAGAKIAFECVILDDGEPSDSFYGVGGMAGMLRPASYGLLEFAP
jgi:hypothetical protein